ncbi:MAG: EAL domain-containing protein [Candidatus Brocadiaceae bacterium]|nr:EAL domain-containing protein [Candidatus Brocadiaceae bacterium]
MHSDKQGFSVLTNLMEKPFKILLVDDNKELEANFLDILESRGFHATGVTNGKEAIDLTRKTCFDLALVDIRLPDILGTEVVEEITKISPTTEFIYITGHASLDTTIKAVKQRCVISYETKPVDVDRLLFTIWQIKRRKLAEEALNEAEERYRVVTETANDAIICLKSPGIICLWNHKAEEMFGYPANFTLGHNLCNLVFSENYYKEICNCVYHFFETGEGLASRKITELSALRKDGTEFPIEISLSSINVGRERQLVIIVRDMTEHIQAKKTIERMAYHDSLTELPNRTLFKDRLSMALEYAHRHGERLAILFLDLDRFKMVNDSLGHAVGDQLLMAVARRLANFTRKSDTVARFGGDEFTLLLTEISHPEDVTKIADKLIDCIRKPLTLVNHELNITASIGIAFYPQDGKDAETIMRNADAAMYHAKESGKNNYKLYNKDISKKVFHETTQTHYLHKALEREEFLLYYQPQVNIHTGEIHGLEALLRWQHPSKRLLSPLDFIPFAENTGLIFPITEWVLRTGCKQICAWNEKGLPPVNLSVNLSAYTFWQENFIESIIQVLDDSGLNAQRLEAELTESILMHHGETTIATLNNLNKLGINISIDDFGTGYSSLANLKKFPIQRIKIDKSFVQDVTADSNSAAIVMAIIAMAKSLNLNVIAEGVETQEQLAFLKEHGCREVQGYLYSKPLPAEDIEVLLKNGAFFHYSGS